MWHLFWPAVALVAVSGAALLVRAALLSGLRRWVRTGAEPVIDTLRVPSILWCLVFGLFVAIEVAELPRRLSDELHVVLEAAVIVSITITLARVLGSLVAAASERRALGLGMSSLAQTAVRLGTLIVGGLVLLSSLGIAVTPILTALGVGGLAVALALQDTLSNLFAGIHLLADKPIRVGDNVKLSVENIEGVVLDVGWRSTRLRTATNDVVIVPNSKVSQSVITNYDLPEPRTTLNMRISVGYATDPDRLEAAVLDETVKAAGDVAGLLAQPVPVVRLVPGFGESSLDFTLTCEVASHAEQTTVQHELRKRLLRRLRRDGFEIPFPTRTVEMRAADGRSADSRG